MFVVMVITLVKTLVHVMMVFVSVLKGFLDTSVKQVSSHLSKKDFLQKFQTYYLKLHQLVKLL